MDSRVVEFLRDGATGGTPEPTSHKFSRLEIYQATHEFEQMIKKHFGEIWKIKSSGEYKGKSWDCRSMITLDAGLWRLLQEARHAGATRVCGNIEIHDTGHMIRFIVLFDKEKETIYER